MVNVKFSEIAAGGAFNTANDQILVVRSSVSDLLVTYAQSNQSAGFYALGNTTQNSSTTLDARSLSFNGIGGISVGYSNGSIQLSGPQTVAQSNQSIGLYALGNTTQNSSTTLDARTLSFNFLGAATGGYSNGSIDVSVPVQTNQTDGWYAVGNTTQNSSTTLDARTQSIGGRGDITVGYSNGTIQISGNQTNQNNSLFALGNTTQNSSTVLGAAALSLNGLGIVTVGFSNGSIQLSATQSAQTAGWYALGNTTQNSSTTLDARTLSLNGLGAMTVGYSNGSINLSVPVQTNQSLGIYASSNTTGASSSSTYDARSLTIQLLGGLSGGWSNGSFQLSGGAGAAQTNQTLGIYASSNTTGASSSSTHDARSLTMQFLGAVSGGWSNGSLQISVAAGGQTNQTVGLYAVGNTTQNSSTTLDARTLSFNFLNNLSGGYSNGSIDIKDPPALSVWRNVGQFTSNNSAGAASNVSVQSMYIPYPLVVSEFMMPVNNTTVGTANNLSSAYLDVSLSGVMYTRNASTLSSVFSFGNSLTTTWNSNNTATVQGILELVVTFNQTTFQPGEYFIAIHMSTNNTATGGANTTALTNAVGSGAIILAYSFNTALNKINVFNGGTNASAGLNPCLGIASTGATVSDLPISSITCTGTRCAAAPVYFELRNASFQ